MRYERPGMLEGADSLTQTRFVVDIGDVRKMIENLSNA